MTGPEFEKYFCEWAKRFGWWALCIPRSQTGSQPFDIIAVRDNSILAVDCKVISSNSRVFPLNRIEDNQWLAFWSLRKRSESAIIGVVVWHDLTRHMCFITYEELIAAVKAQQKSIPLVNKGVDRIEILCKTASR